MDELPIDLILWFLLYPIANAIALLIAREIIRFRNKTP